MFKLNPASDEQKLVIKEIKNHNVIVDSVAGSGKSTTAMHIAETYCDKQILNLVYNKRLQLETIEKLEKLCINNMNVYTFHSFAYNFFSHECSRDDGIFKVLKNASKIKPLNEYSFDILIIDEVQDMTPLLYKLVRLIYFNNAQYKNIRNKKQSKIKIPICIFGDKNQAIYQFKDADSRFITMAPELFIFNKLEWKYISLSTSYRITKPMADFVNTVMLHENRLNAVKPSNIKPQYIICDAFAKDTFKIFQEILNKGYDPSDIFVIASSVKSEGAPVRRLENNIKKHYGNKINVFVPVDDETPLNTELIKNKVVFSTFCQVKGLERKVVIVFGFDMSYFTFYDKHNTLLNICPNPFYVATTRAKEELYLIHHFQNNYLPFLNKRKLHDTADVRQVKTLKVKERPQSNGFKKGVTELCRFLPNAIEILNSYEFKTDTIKPINKRINIPLSVVQNNSNVESVAEITGTAIPLYYQYIKKDYIYEYELLKSEGNPQIKLLNSDDCNTEDLNNADNINQYINNDSDDDMIVSDEENINNLNNSNNLPLTQLDLTWDYEDINIPRLLYLATHICQKKDKYLFRTHQIDNYDWLTEEALDQCIFRLNKLKLDNCKFEYLVSYNNTLYNWHITGFIDCLEYVKIDHENKEYELNLYEFKCCDRIETQHYIQVLCYTYLLHYKYDQKYPDSNIKINTFIYNILTDEMQQIYINNIEDFFHDICRRYNGKGIMLSDEDFIKQQLEK